MKARCAVILAASVLACGATHAAAQGVSDSPLLKLSQDDMRKEIDKRYNEALAKTLAPEVVKADNNAFTWASEAKVACGIAIGFLKSHQVDTDSVNKCDLAYRLMNAPPPPPPAPPPPPPPPPPVAEKPAICSANRPFLVYFAFDVDKPPSDAETIITQIAQGMGPCGWTGLTVTGHTDRAGSDSYNQKLSDRRAKNVAAQLATDGVSTGALTVSGKGEKQPAVQTDDGVKEPLNRRVEIMPSPAQ